MRLPRRAGMLAVVAAVAAALAATATAPHAAEGCAFLRRPFAYEADQARRTYLDAIDAASVNQLLPGDPYFGLPAIEVGGRNARRGVASRLPATLLKAIAWAESTMTMAARSVRFESAGLSLVSFDCGHGVMQVTTGMTVPLGAGAVATDRQVSVATHYAYNIARGAAILADKWNQAPDQHPIVGALGGADPTVFENWYYAVWSYNGFTGPGSNSSNHPLDPSFAAPRAAYRCDGTQSASRYPYQELVWGCAAHPPSRDSALLWTPLPASLPNLSAPQWFEPLSLARFVFPFAGMDIPTPQPAHVDPAPTVAAGFAATLGLPALRVTAEAIVLRLDGLPQDGMAIIEIANAGTGILSWSATSAEPWLVADPPAGVALGSDVVCAAPGCERTGSVRISVNLTLLPDARATGTLRIRSATTGSERLLVVQVDADFEVAAPGTSRAD